MPKQKYDTRAGHQLLLFTNFLSAYHILIDYLVSNQPQDSTLAYVSLSSLSLASIVSLCALNSSDGEPPTINSVTVSTLLTAIGLSCSTMSTASYINTLQERMTQEGSGHPTSTPCNKTALRGTIMRLQ